MIRVTDATLSCLEPYCATSRQLKRLLELLIEIKVDFIELTPAVYRSVGFLDPRGKDVLRVKMPGETDFFPEFSRFVCKNRGLPTHPNITTEIQVNDMREAYLLRAFEGVKSLRITGLDDILLHDYPQVFDDIRGRVNGRLELCPENRYHCATATAVEWILGGGTDIVTTFGGIAQKAPLEEVLLALRLSAHHKPGNRFSVFPEMKELVEEITREKFSATKAVIGSNIFHVESGIHVDGIIKQQRLYEPYTPELVGNSRKVVVGKHSGLKSIRLKLEQSGKRAEEYDVRALLDAVKQESVRIGGALSDEAFSGLAQKYLKGGAQ
jgi:homocitrate synthase NifV